MPQVPGNAEPLASLHSTMGQPDADLQRPADRSRHLSADPYEPERVEYVIDRAVPHRGTGVRTEYKVRWYGYGADDDTYEPASELPTTFF